MNNTFHVVDAHLSEIAARDNTNSGCTAVTVFLRIENEDGSGVFAPAQNDAERGAATTDPSTDDKAAHEKKSVGAKVKDVVSKIAHLSHPDHAEDQKPLQGEPTKTTTGSESALFVPDQHAVKRVLYTANVGDARAVLWCVLLLSRRNRPISDTYIHAVATVKQSG